MNRDINLSSIEKAPLIRKFTVLFIIMSLMPFLIIAYLFAQYYIWHGVGINKTTLFILLFLSGAGTLTGFYGMRKSIMGIRKVTENATKALAKNASATLRS